MICPANYPSVQPHCTHSGQVGLLLRMLATDQEGVAVTKGVPRGLSPALITGIFQTPYTVLL